MPRSIEFDGLETRLVQFLPQAPMTSLTTSPNPANTVCKISCWSSPVAGRFSDCNSADSVGGISSVWLLCAVAAPPIPPSPGVERQTRNARIQCRTCVGYSALAPGLFKNQSEEKRRTRLAGRWTGWGQGAASLGSSGSHEAESVFPRLFSRDGWGGGDSGTAGCEIAAHGASYRGAAEAVHRQLRGGPSGQYRSVNVTGPGVLPREPELHGA